MSRIFSCLLLAYSLVSAGTGIQAAVPDTATVTFHTYGLVRGGGDAPRAVVSRRWHIEYESVAGCVVTEALIDSANAHNARTEAVLVRRWGNDWRKRYEAEIDAEAKRQKAITARLDSSTEIKALRTKLKSDYNTPWYRIDFNERNKLYTVEVKAWNKKANDYRTYYVLTAGQERWELRKMN